ncbi:hypothetical protein R1sor_008028 [Riccia sorocarpa]|uniref:Peroxidase n=1 Tax=Riccia sorocarpa TaxID=122646 RepID=A0ABD3HVN8_9MARC
MATPLDRTRKGLSTFGFLLVLCTAICRAQLSETFYSTTCPQLLTLVQAKVAEFIAADRGVAAGLLRLHFHDCFVRGCDASVLLDSPSNTAEKDAVPSLGSVRGISEINQVKAVIEAACPGVVSCADIITIVARDAIAATGGPTWSVPLGRRDGFISSKAEALANVPSPNDNFGQLVRNFARVGLSVQDLVILTGAHTIGRSHCAPVMRRLYNFTGVAGATDPSISPSFVTTLMQLCPQNQGKNLIAMDTSNGTFDITYYVDLLANKGLFTSDATLLSNPFSLQLINTIVTTPSFFLSNFAAAMVRMGNISLLTGSAGEVRLNCSRTNNG